MIPEALPCPQRDGLQKGYQSCRLIPSTPALAHHLSQGEVKAGQVMARFTPRPQQSRLVLSALALLLAAVPTWAGDDQDKAARIIRDLGGEVERDDAAPGKPVVGVAFSSE